MTASKKDNFAGDLGTQDYEFKDELKIRKVLERETDWQFKFSKNDKYAYDMAITKWGDSPQSPDDNEVIGYVELERSRRDKKYSWVTGSIPENWYYLSFLQRKVRDYDHRTKCWEGLKKDYDRTVYMKFNHAMDNCFAASVETIHQDGTQTKRSDGSYRGTYLALDKDHPDVHVGLSDCVEFIKNYLTKIDKGQSRLSSYK